MGELLPSHFTSDLQKLNLACTPSLGRRIDRELELSLQPPHRVARPSHVIDLSATAAASSPVR